jgi:SAM-dependent methyltransferase
LSENGKSTRTNREICMWNPYEGQSAAHYDRIWREFTHRMLEPTIRQAQSSLPEHAQILDVGCGTGVLLAALGHHQPDLRLLGTDASPAMLAQAAHRLGHTAQLVVWHLDQPPPPAVLEAAPFALITCTNVLHYLHEPTRTVQLLASLLAPDGRLIIVDFVWHGWWWPIFEGILHLVDRHHRRTLRKSRLIHLLTLAGLQIDQVQSIAAGGLWRGVLVLGKPRDL